MPVRVSALWDQVASRLDPENVDVDAAQRAVLRAAGYSWDDNTGELTDWPKDAPVFPRPAERTSREGPRECATVDLVSPDPIVSRRASEKAKPVLSRDFDVDRSESRNAPSPSTSGRSERSEHLEDVISIAISDSASPTGAVTTETRAELDGLSPDATLAARMKKRRRAEDAPRTDQTDLDPATLSDEACDVTHQVPPSFVNASLVSLQRELAEHGMKPGPREYMTRELNRAWAAGAVLSETFFRASGIATEPSGRQNVPADSNRGGGVLSSREVGMERGKRKPANELNRKENALEDALGGFIKSNRALYDRALLMETVDADDVLEALARDCEWRTRRVSRAKLLAYLEEEGVAVTRASGRRARTTGRTKRF